MASNGVLNETNLAVQSNPDWRLSSGAEKRQMTVFTSADAKERRARLSIICFDVTVFEGELLKVFSIANIEPRIGGDETE